MPQFAPPASLSAVAAGAGPPLWPLPWEAHRIVSSLPLHHADPARGQRPTVPRSGESRLTPSGAKPILAAAGGMTARSHEEGSDGHQGRERAADARRARHADGRAAAPLLVAGRRRRRPAREAYLYPRARRRPRALPRRPGPPRRRRRALLASPRQPLPG